MNTVHFVQTIDLSPLNREECNQLLLRKGFFRREKTEDPIPEEFQSGPYVSRDEL